MPSPASITSRPKSFQIQLDDIPLNSPSSQIVGTPYANDTTRFEYPFPDTNQSGNSEESSSGTTSDFCGSVPSSSPSTSFTSSQILTQLSFPPHSHHPTYNITHPKMKVQTNPPIPPNLVKRRLRWSLKMLGRKSSTGSQQSTTSDDSIITDISDGQEPASPIGVSPIQELVKH